MDRDTGPAMAVGWVLGLGLGVLLSWLAGPTAGSEHGKCYGNNTCDSALSCRSNVCVKEPAP